ncbi:MAG: hypothetical protein KIT56_04055 [Gammaproteobacteria bacterium]|nr:hypothetical protein [Gammaproteobacteria bacterium]MCW5583050.1 hypothetical protein [Gammaproteobacteria bacterium]
MSLDRLKIEDKFLNQLYEDNKDLQSRQYDYLMGTTTDLSDDYNSYQFVMKSWHMQQASNRRYEDIKEAYKSSNYEVIELRRNNARPRFGYDKLTPQTIPCADFGRYNKITNPSDYVVRSTGDAFCDENQRLSSILASGKAIPHKNANVHQNKSLEQRIYDHRNKEEGGQEGMISYTYPDLRGHLAVDWYAKRQFIHAKRKIDASLPILIVSSGEGMAAENRNSGEDIDWGFNQVTAVQPTDILAVRPYTISSTSVSRSNYVLVRKDLTEEQKLGVIAAVKRPDEEPVNQMGSNIPIKRSSFTTNNKWYMDVGAKNDSSLFFNKKEKQSIDVQLEKVICSMSKSQEL